MNSRTRALCLFLALTAGLVVSMPASGQQRRRPMQPEDCFKLKDITGLQISPDGLQAVFVQREANLKENKYVQSIWLLSVDGRTPPRRLIDHDNDGSPAWVPDGKIVAFLSTRGGNSQVWTIELATGSIRQMTSVPTGVVSFKWAPDGKHLAIISPGGDDGTYKKRISNGQKGAVIDKLDFVVYRLLGNQLFLDQERGSDLWLVNTETGHAEQVTKGIRVATVEWSPASLSLAIAASRVDLPSYAAASTIYLYSVDSAKTEEIISGHGGDSFDQIQGYSSPVWSPDGSQLAVLSAGQKDRWAALQTLAVYSLSNKTLSQVTKEEDLELYSPAFHWISGRTAYLENTYRAARGLYELSLDSGKVTPFRFRDSAAGYDSQFSFSADGSRAVFVHQSTGEPPEIYSCDISLRQRKKLTSLNQFADDFELPIGERVRWRSTDGVDAEGWLLKPAGFQTNRRYPLIVLIHGGPVAVMSDRFEMYSMDGAGLIWPYPLRLWAQRGYAVFVPNYRGTGSYGKPFRSPHDLSDEPFADIVSGIDYLVAKGIADPSLIGITGQSHGGWLGPYVMTHKKIFKAASFAEGGVDLISAYGQMPGWLNRNIHDYYYGGNPYDDPARYLKLSPIFDLKGLTTPTLLEYGEQSLAVQGLEFYSALWREGVPQELVIYPKTGHNISSPVLQLESMERNLDWFDYWMLGKKDPSAGKQEQYARWDRKASEMRQIPAPAPGSIN
jgi:dipeptidyl aminopeptidase/acylaminoacyl peptidase